MTKNRLKPIPNHKIVEECLRSYCTYREYVGNTGKSVIEHSYLVFNEDGTVKEKITTQISFWDLFKGVKKLSKRKREAIWWIAISGYTQEETGKIMGCRPVTCGQYLKAGCQQLAKEVYKETIEKP